MTILNDRNARFGHLLLGCFACAVLSPFIAAQGTSSSQTSETMAVFAGQSIDESQLPPAEVAQLQRMMQQVFGVRRRALQTVLNQKLVEAEAKKKGVSVADLVKSEVDSRVVDPSDEQVNAYYQAHQGQINQPLEDARNKIRQDIKAQEIQQARTIYVQGLMQRAVSDGQLTVLLSPPKVELPVDPARLRGDTKAPVTIVEFSDFSCPYCRQAESTMKELLAKYQGKVRLTYRDFPLREVHPHAQLAAEASRCAGEQGEYWEYHDLLFASPDKQARDDLIAYASALNLDNTKFDACLNSGHYKPDIEQDIRIGNGAGVVATPAFFVNGTFLNGAQPAAVFEKIIDEQLAASGLKPKAN